ncbi:MAG: hypothetical protein P8Y23_17550 [Candidatus Lokiarchaeota archaeon]
MFEVWWLDVLGFVVLYAMLFLFRIDLCPFNTMLNILGFVGVVVTE